MADFVLTGKDTHIINGRTLTALATGLVSKLMFPNEQGTVKTGKNGNAMFGFNSSGRQAEQTIRVIRGSDDDKFMNSIFASHAADPTTFVLMAGEFVKNLGDGNGNVIGDSYVTSGGVPGKRVEVEDDAEGNPEQGLAEYHFKWADAERVIA